MSGFGVSAAVLLAVSCLARAGSDPVPETSGGGWADLSFGFKVGGILAQHVGTEERNSEYEVSSGWRTGFSAGAFLLWPVTSRFGLQQEVVFAQRGSSQEIDVEILEIPTTLFVTYRTDYVDIPVLLRYALLQWEGGDLYTLAGTAMSLRVGDRYTLEGVLDDGEQSVPLTADADMSEVDLFDFSMLYGTGTGFRAAGFNMLLEYRFQMGWNTLSMPTYAYVPFGDSLIMVENEPVPLKNQSHSILLGVRF